MKRLTFIFTIFALVLTFSSCNFDKKSVEDRPIRIRLKWLHQSQFAGFYTAQQKGFYKENGISVILNSGGIDFPSISLVLNGGDDFGVAGADQVIEAVSSGKPIVAVATIYKRTPFCLFSFEEKGIKSIADFDDNLIGVKYGGNEEFTYRAMLAAAISEKPELNNMFISKDGIYKSKNEVSVKYDLTPFLNGEVDVWPGYSINEPILAEKMSQKKVSIISPSDYNLILYADVLFTTKEMLKEHPEIVKKVVSGTIKGWEYALNENNYDEVVNYVLRYAVWSDYDHEMKMLSESRDLVLPPNEEGGIMDPNVWSNMQSIMYKYKFVEKESDPNTFFTNKSFE